MWETGRESPKASCSYLGGRCAVYSKRTELWRDSWGIICYVFGAEELDMNESTIHIKSRMQRCLETHLRHLDREVDGLWEDGL